MKRKILATLLLFLVASPCYPYGFDPNPHDQDNIGLVWGDSYEPEFRVPASYEFESLNKLTVAYQEFLTMLDEYNREHGISAKPYVQDFYGKVPEYNENINMIPVWMEEEDSYSPAALEAKSPKYFRQDQINVLLSNPTSAESKKMIASFTKEFQEKEKRYRFYFGNGNQIENLRFEEQTQFNATKNIGTKHLFDGKYKVFTGHDWSGNPDDDNVNSLEITRAEYDQYFGANGEKPKNDPILLNFIKGRLESRVSSSSGYTFRVGADGEIYATKNGVEKRVLWNAYRVSIRDRQGGGYSYNTVLTKVLLFDKNVAGNEIAYKENGDIVFKELFSDPTGSTLKFGWSALSSSSSSKFYTDELIESYTELQDGKILEKDFKEKWNFTDDSFYTDLNALAEKQKAYAENDKIYKTKSDVLGWVWTNYNASWTTAAEKLDIYNGNLSSSDKADLKNKGIDVDTPEGLQKFQNLIDELIPLAVENTQLETERDALKTALEGNPAYKRFSTAELKENISGITGKKEIRFGGQGRVNGSIDLGKGYNTLIVGESDKEYTGKYGTNIILGANVKLKNINVIGVGRQASASLGASGLSGVTSLSMEVDTKKFNNKGHLYQHALKDTWQDSGSNPTRIVFRKAAAGWGLADKYRNDFVIELRTSGITKDGTIIDMGRPLEYKDDFEGYRYKINLISDSILQDLVTLDYKSDEGYDLVQVRFKDAIGGLTGGENKVYRSIVSSGMADTLLPTLTTSNKKTLFSTPEADRAEQEKNMKLALALKDENQTPEKILQELPDFKIREQDRAELVRIIRELKNSEKIKNFRGMMKTLKKYEKIDTTEAQKAMEQVVQEFAAFPQHITGSEAQNMVDAKIGDDAKINAKIDELKAFYKKHIESFHNALVVAKPYALDGETEVFLNNDGTPPAEVLRGHLAQKGLKFLLEPEGTTPKEKLLNMISNYRTYLRTLKEFDGLSQKAVEAAMLTDLQFKDELYKMIRSSIYYSRRQTEALNEFKTVLKQLYDKNIYAKVNKISKDEIGVFTPLIVDSEFDFAAKKPRVRGGTVAGRFAREDFKGTIYSGYGLYERPLKDDLTFGFVMGGGTSDFHEIVNDDNKTVTTNSTIKGGRVYLGGFRREAVKDNIDWISGLGMQFSFYDVEREMKNNYQYKKYKGDLNTYTGTLYSGVLYTYSLKDGLDALNLKFKGGLAYTMVFQGKTKEKDIPLAIQVKSKAFNYLDGQAGLGLAKSVRGDKLNSSLSGMLTAAYGLVGYDNNDLKACFNGSSDFDIQGESYKKASVNLTLDYNVIYDAGFNYGLEGSYTQNGNEDNISVGVKAGYSF